MVEALARRVRDVCRELVGEALLVVTVYDADEIYHEYIVDEVEAQSDRIAMDALHRPVMSLHRTLEFVTQLNEIGGDHQGSVHHYEHVTYLHFPVGDRSGIVVSLDPRSDRVDEAFTEGRSVIDGRSPGA